MSPPWETPRFALTTLPFQLSVLRWIPREDYFQIAPETISERMKSKIFLGEYAPRPPYMAGVSCVSHIYTSLSLVRFAQPRERVARWTISDQCDHTYKPA